MCVFIFFNFKDDLTLCRDKLLVNSVHLCEMVNTLLSLKKKNMFHFLFKQNFIYAIVSPRRALWDYTLLGTQFGVRLAIMSVGASV